MQKIAIVGGGLTGLSLAYYLSKNKKYEISIFEKEPQFGGLIAPLTIEGVGLEGYYHHLFKGDKEIIDLVRELGLENKLLYLESKIGIFYRQKKYLFSTPFDLLNFTPLSFLDRIRLGLTALYLQNFITEKNWRRLRHVSAAQWMKKYAGEKAYKVVWQPLLKGKFGPDADKVSMAWLWSRLHLRGRSRGGGGRKEELVYFQGGFKTLVDKLVQKVKEKGCFLRPGLSVREISSLPEGKISLKLSSGEKKVFDKCVATVPNPEFIKLTPGLPQKTRRQLAKVKYRGAMNAVLQIKKQFMKDIYWLNINDQDIKLLAVVEHTNFVKPQMYKGKRILYAGSYPAQDDPVMNMSEKDLISLVSRELKKINPLFESSWIEKYWIFRDRFAQPVVTTDYHTFLPPLETGLTNLYLTNTAQVYPEDRGTNQAVRQAEETARQIR